MNQQKGWMYLLLALVLVACSGKSTTAGGEEQQVRIKTVYGNIVIKLYNETPKHRDNFIQLVKEDFYDGLLFHRVIDSFMIQGGDPESKNAAAKQQLGSGGPGYTIPAEIVEGLYHKKGALAAARQGDNVNPERASSGSQFYIVHGKIWNEKALNDFEDQQKFKASRMEFMKLYREALPTIQRLQSEGKIDSIDDLKIMLQEKAESSVENSGTPLDEKRREVYSSIGGTPHLDGAYTVFGQVVEGFDVLDSLAAVPTGPSDRPLEDLVMEIELID